MNRQPQRDFLPVTQDYPPAAACADAILYGDPDTEPADDYLMPRAEALRYLRPTGADPLPIPPDMPDLPDTGPISPDLEARAYKLGLPYVEAIGRGEYHTPPEVLETIRRDMAQEQAEDVERLQRQYPPSAPGPAESHVAPPQGLPDAYTPSGIYCPSQKMIDAMTDTPEDRVMWQRLQAYADDRQRVRIEPGGRAQFVSSDEQPDRAAADMGRIAGYFMWTLILFGFCAVGAWCIASVWAGVGR